MIRLDHIRKTFHPGTADENTAIRDLSLTVAEGDFITIIGSNGYPDRCRSGRSPK